MISNILILTSAGIVIGAIFKYFLYDIMSIPVNGLFYYYKKKEEPIKQAMTTLFGGLLLFIVFTYLFSGICSSFVSWAISKAPESNFLKIYSLACATGIPFSLRQNALKISAQDSVSFQIPNVMAAKYFPFLVLIIAIFISIFPSVRNFWSWMPYVG